MKNITNKLGLPEPLVEAIRNSSYDPGESDITATGIIEPIRMHMLKEKYAEQITEDASDLIYSLQGQSIHTILERAAAQCERNGYIAERRFYIRVGGRKLGAQIDLFDTKRGILQDYKVTSVYSVKDGPKEDYVKQLNIQAECMRQSGHEVKSLQIVAILRDWSKGERDRDIQAFGEKAKYPAHQVVMLDVPLIPSEEVIVYLNERIVALAGELPLCTPEERWARPDTYALMKKGQKRAVQLFASEEAAQLILETKGKDHKIDFRPGINMRCENYCVVSQWCDQFLSSKGVKK